jgi:C_GCAxxG_C_C family probable redox protein
MDHTEEAYRLFKSGCNCAQAVFTAFRDVTGLDFETSMRLSSAFGGGMGRMREVCGACSGIFMVLGYIYGYDTPGDDEGKKKLYADVQYLASKFKERHGGTIVCRELLKNAAAGRDTSPTPEPRTNEYYKRRPCADFVSDAAEILDEFIYEEKSKNEV